MSEMSSRVPRLLLDDFFAVVLLAVFFVVEPVDFLTFADEDEDEDEEDLRMAATTWGLVLPASF